MAPDLLRAGRTEGPIAATGSGGRESGSLGDCIQNQGAILQEVRNRGNYEPLLNRLRYLCRQFPGASITVFSGYRSPQHNQSVGGARNSRHMLADALDFRINANPERVKRVLGQFPGGRGSYGDGSFHIDLGPNRCWAGMQAYCGESRIMAQGFERQVAGYAQREQRLVQALGSGLQENGDSRALANVNPQVSGSVHPYLVHGIPTLNPSTDSGLTPSTDRVQNATVAMGLLTNTVNALANFRPAESANSPARSVASVAKPTGGSGIRSGASSMPGGGRHESQRREHHACSRGWKRGNY